MTEQTTSAERDAAVIRDLRVQRAKLEERGTADTWSLRLTLGEIDTLLRACDERDDLKRRLLGEWEGDVPDPLPAVTVTTFVDDLGAADRAAQTDEGPHSWYYCKRFSTFAEHVKHCPKIHA